MASASSPSLHLATLFRRSFDPSETLISVRWKKPEISCGSSMQTPLPPPTIIIPSVAKFGGTRSISPKNRREKSPTSTLNPLRIDRFRVVDEMSYREEKKVISPPRFIWTTRRWTVFRVDGPSFGGKHAERKITNSRVAGEAETERRKRRMGGLGGACDDEINNRPTRKLRKLVLLCSDRCGFSPRKDEEGKGRIPDE